MNPTTILIQEIAAKTRQGKIEWKETETDNEFIAFFAENAVRISKEPSTTGSDLPDFFFGIANDNGDLIYVVNDEQLENLGLEDSYEILSRIHETAHTQSIGLDRAISNIMNQLKNK